MSQPPRFVPTLTEVVQTGGVQGSSGALMPASTLLQREEQMVDRVLQRVNISLDRRLREAAGRLILEQIQGLTPRLHEEIEKVVRETISAAFAAEIARPTADDADDQL